VGSEGCEGARSSPSWPRYFFHLAMNLGSMGVSPKTERTYIGRTWGMMHSPRTVIARSSASKVAGIIPSDCSLTKAATEGDTMIGGLVEHVINIPHAPELLAPLIEIVPLQLLAYYIAVRRGCDVDQPRNLAKSVTVE